MGKTFLPIWFFVGVVLGIYGIILVVTGAIVPVPPMVQVLKVSPDILWGLVLLVVGVFFAVLGYKLREDEKKG
jgi:membrane-bound ClpP family serine protease